MSFRLWTIFYAFAELAAAMAVFGPLGIVLAVAVLGFWAYCWKHGHPKIKIRNWIIVAVVIAVLWSLLIPALPSAREAAQRVQCVNNLKQIAIAIMNYADVNGTLPPAFLADASGKPMHSWRVLILPYLEEPALFKKYNLSEPWNGPNNSQLANQIPEVYRCPSHPDARHGDSPETSYFTVVGPETAFSGSVGRPFKNIADGTANTILVIEASGLERNWMDPHGVTFEEALELLTAKPRSGHRAVSEGFFTTTYYETSDRNVAFCDAHVVWMGQLKDPRIARALLTCAGGESSPTNPHNANQEFVRNQQFLEPVTTTVIKWGRIWGLTLFVVLSLLPTAWLRRRAVQKHDDGAVVA